jgi:hypothetical protein
MFDLMATWNCVLVLAAAAPLAGRVAFSGVFAALIVWLLFVPASRLGEQDTNRSLWRTSRFWAVLVAASQMVVYLLWK